MKYFFLLPLLLLLILPTVIATDCTPEAGFSFCREFTSSYADSTATARIQSSDVNNFITTISENGKSINLYLKEASINYKGIDSVLVSNIYNAIEKICNANGCIATELSNTGKLTLAVSGQEYTNPVSLIAFSCSGECGKNNSLAPWTSAATNLVWDNKTYRAVDCYYNSNCGVGQYCDVSGDWKTWKCINEECSKGQEKCIGDESFICSVNNVISGKTSSFLNQGAIIGKCGAVETSELLNISFSQPSIQTATGDNLYLILGIIGVVILILLWMGGKK